MEAPRRKNADFQRCLQSDGVGDAEADPVRLSDSRVRKEYEETIGKLKDRINELSGVVASDREKLVECDAVKRKLVALDAKLINQSLQLEKATKEIAALRKVNEDIRVENSSLLRIYEHEVRRADFLQGLCIDLDEENKGLHEKQGQSSYVGTPDVPSRVETRSPSLPDASYLQESSSLSTSAPAESFYQDDQLRRRSRRTLEHLTELMCERRRRGGEDITPR
ncbi:uncharacterized protein LOC100905207 [Galendromus occidentalis]|uniref:Uncharacterized protein LOC100905207 n=1 Tax=Galendromus occidentalis TaxID=34638 RepID=A0AAJ6VZP6_9ACAR|nr:uncharacterized protein LOC100905207 [Galendromus occidentalis]